MTAKQFFELLIIYSKKFFYFKCDKEFVELKLRSIDHLKHHVQSNSVESRLRRTAIRRLAVNGSRKQWSRFSLLVSWIIIIAVEQTRCAVSGWFPCVWRRRGDSSARNAVDDRTPVFYSRGKCDRKQPRRKRPFSFFLFPSPSFPLGSSYANQRKCAAHTQKEFVNAERSQTRGTDWTRRGPMPSIQGSASRRLTTPRDSK